MSLALGFKDDRVYVMWVLQNVMRMQQQRNQPTFMMQRYESMGDIGFGGTPVNQRMNQSSYLSTGNQSEESSDELAPI